MCHFVTCWRRLTPPPRRQIMLVPRFKSNKLMRSFCWYTRQNKKKTSFYMLQEMGVGFFIGLFFAHFTPIGLEHFVCNFHNISKSHSEYEYLLTEGTDKNCDILCNLVTLLKAKKWIQEKMARNKIAEHTHNSIIILNVCNTDPSGVHPV